MVSLARSPDQYFTSIGTGILEKWGDTYMVTSTSSIVIFPWMVFIAAPAFFMAASVSWLMFADSMEYICCSSMDI